MFNRIEVGDKLPHASQPPSIENCQELLVKLNENDFSDRFEPKENILAELE